MLAQVMVLPLAEPQVVAPKMPLNPLPPILTVPVGAGPLPAHVSTAVIVTGAVLP